jgi:hypothetical protein
LSGLICAKAISAVSAPFFVDAGFGQPVKQAVYNHGQPCQGFVDILLALQVVLDIGKSREYERIWIYIPTKVSEGTSFPFRVRDPCLVQLDTERKQLLVKRIGREEAVTLGWRERKRRTG